MQQEQNARKWIQAVMNCGAGKTECQFRLAGTHKDEDRRLDLKNKWKVTLIGFSDRMLIAIKGEG